MDQTFRYNVVPNPGRSTVSTRIVFQDELTQGEIVAAAAAASGATPEVVTAIGTSILSQIIIAARSGRRTRRLFDLYSFTPRCGGTHADPDFQPTAENMNVGINGNLAPDGEALFADGITFVRDAVLGEKTPQVTRVYDAVSRQLDKVSSGGSFRITGSDFGPEPDPASTTAGVFLRPVTGGEKLQLQGFSGWTDTEITGAWPVGDPANYELIVAAHYPRNTAPSIFTYGTVLVFNP